MRASGFCLTVALAVALASPAAAATTFTHDQMTTGWERIGSVPNAGLGIGVYKVESLEITVTNSTTKTWTDYHFRISIPSGGGFPGDFVEITSLTVPAPPFDAGKRAKSAGSTHFDLANYFDGSLAPGGSFTADFKVNHSSSFDISGLPTFPGGGAPEPATWAMLTAGLGFTGVAVRRRRSRRKGTSPRIKSFS